jgi:hypothetical protein
VVSRGVSTVLDAAVFLLLLTAAVATLTIPAAHHRAPDSSSVRTTLATSTASVEYTLAPGARQADADGIEFSRVEGPEFQRTAHGSLAGLLADGARRNVTVDGVRVTRTATDFERELAATVRNATGRRTRVVATWTPYRGAPVRGRTAVGRRPPPDATVASETIVLDSGMPPARARARRAADRSGFEGVAEVVADATVAGTFPPAKARLALRGDYPDDRLLRYRYRRFGRLLAVEIGAVDAERVAPANRRLRSALTDRFERDLRERFDSPRAAARSVRVGEVRLVVGRWSA